MSGHGLNVPNQPVQGQNAQQQGNQAQNNPVPQNPAPQWGARPQARRGVGAQPLAGRQAALQPGVAAPQVQNPVNNPVPVLPQNPQPVNAPVNNPGLAAQQQFPPVPQVPQQGVGGPPQFPPVPPVPQQGVGGPPQFPPVPQPPDMTGFIPKDVAEVDQVGLKVRRWSVSMLTALGLTPRSSQDRVLASTVATAARIDESSCQPNVGRHCSAALKLIFTPVQLAQDPAFSGLVAALEIFENSGRWTDGQKKARGTNEVAPLRQAAVAYEQSLQNVANPDPTKKAALDEVKRVTRAFELRDQVASYGQPPWDTNTARQASKAKVELDILSMPAGSRVAQPPPGGVGGVNTKVWINRTGGTGQQQGSYICKPAAASAVDGIPDGGEVAREALVQRAAGILGQKLSVDLNVPETHSIALNNSYLPEENRNKNGASTACSIQELRPNKGPARGKSKQDLKLVPRDQVHGLIALDICTLNLDRHKDNLLVDANNELVPIDHGASLPEPVLNKRKKGLARVRDAMPSPHNVMLKFPQAHEPMSNDMCDKLAKIKPKAISGQLATERDDIANELTGQVTLSDAALGTSKRALEFMKLAAQKYKTLSPAAVQVVLGKNATTLLDPDLSDEKFPKAATRALDEAMKNQAVIKEACLMNPVEHEAMKDKLVQGGWDLPKQRAPGASVLCDPALALKLALSGTKRPKPMPPWDANAAKMQAPLPGKGAPNANKQQQMESLYPQLKKLSAIENYRIDMSEEWAAFEALRAIEDTSPEELAEIVTFAIVSSDRELQFPTMMLRGVQQMRHIKETLADAEQKSGGALPAIQNQLLDLKVNSARQIIGLLRGELNGQFTILLKEALQKEALPDRLDAVTGVSDKAFERVRYNFRKEVNGLKMTNAIKAADAKNIEADIDAGDLVAANRGLNAVPGHNRPDTV